MRSGQRDQREGADRERKTQSKQAILQVAQRPLAGDARPGEQPRQEEEHRHEEAVGGEHDHVEAEERLRIGMAEIRVGDHGVMQQHHQRQEGAGAIERRVARFGGRHGIGHRGRNGGHGSPGGLFLSLKSRSAIGTGQGPSCRGSRAKGGATPLLRSSPCRDRTPDVPLCRPSPGTGFHRNRSNSRPSFRWP